MAFPEILSPQLVRARQNVRKAGCFFFGGVFVFGEEERNNSDLTEALKLHCYVTPDE